MRMDTPMLTTYDNPYNPYTHFREWALFDAMHGYNSAGLLARLAPSSDKICDTENDRFADAAIDSFIKHDILGLYVKVTPETAPKIAQAASEGNFFTVLSIKEPTKDS